MNKKVLGIFIALAMLPTHASAELLTRTSSLSLVQETHISDVGNSQAPVKYNKAGLNFNQFSKYDWGGWLLGIDAVDPFATGASNDFLDSINAGAYAEYRIRSTIHKDIGDSNFNWWMYNFMVANQFMLENNNYIGFSYDLEFAGFQIKPAIGYNITVNTNNPNSNTQKYGITVNGETEVITSYVATAIIFRPFSVGDYTFFFKGYYEGQFQRDSEYNAYAGQINDEEYGHQIRLGLQFPISQKLSAGITFVDKLNFGGYGEDGEVIEFNLEYNF
ncbi:hypothetical protein JK628_03095 [Shewanella sp. KX20019]|uniref:hypothetical protein n=1 Tax=Shewanella sp. KX20019 TaxID=2803864 RepID=UPI001928F29E|nr:hypothetical protein [Shewanella sp. KX20019]QQX80877.1 hypothetical protein JK628_03095 [Shewanella sp. KX20019]